MTTDKESNLVNATLVSIAITFIFAWLLQFLWKRRYLYIYSWHIPGPIAFPFIGCGYIFFSPQIKDVMEYLINVQKFYSDIFRIWIGTKLIYFVSRPEHIEKLLTTPKAQDKDSFYDFIIDAMGEGLLTSKGQKWKKHRKVFMPAFSQKSLDYYELIFARKAEIFADILQKEVGNNDLDLLKLLYHLNLDIICETALGVNMEIQSSNSSFDEYLAKALVITSDRMCSIQHQLRFTWNLYPISKLYKSYIDNLMSFRNSVIEKKFESMNTQKVTAEYSKKITLLEQIFESSDLTEEDRKIELNALLIAGSVTTANELCCIFIMLGMFPEIQQKLFEEILDILGSDGQVTPSDLPKMKYTERVIKETLRLFPVAPFFLRTIKENIEIDDMVYPAGASVFFTPINIHRNPKYWPDPLKFDPDRFLPENVDERHPGAYIPFSYGPRNCIGAQYAMMNMKTIVAAVVKRFKIHTQYKSIDEMEYTMKIFLNIKGGPKIWMESR